MSHTQTDTPDPALLLAGNMPAFPVAWPDSAPNIGMSLRDWFASRAPEPPPTWWGGGAKDCAGYALWNFQYADAMLAERAK